MTTSNQPPSSKEKNDGILAFLTSILKKSSSSDLPQDVNFLTAAVSMLTDQLTQVIRSVESIVVAIDNQNKAINDLYTVQEFLLKQLKPDHGIDSSLPSISKTKPDKPN